MQAGLFNLMKRIGWLSGLVLLLTVNVYGFDYRTDFNTLDREFWLVYNHGGWTGPYSEDYDLASIQNESDGNKVLLLSVDSTDHGPELITKSIRINENSVVTAEWRAKLHYGNEYFAGYVGFNLVDYDGFYDPYKGDQINPFQYFDEVENRAVTKTAVNVYYRNYYYNNYEPPVGGNAFGICGGGQCLTSPAIWDEFVTNKVELDFTQRKAKFWQNGNYVGDVPISSDLDLQELPYLKIHFSPYGWYTGHKMELDWFHLSVTNSSDDEDESDQNVNSCQASFDLFSNTLKIPCLNYNNQSLQLNLIRSQGQPTLLFTLTNHALNSDLNLLQSTCAASFDLFSSTLTIPCLNLDGRSYWVKLLLIQTTPNLVFSLQDFGLNSSSASSEQVNLSSMDRYQISFVTGEITSRPNYNPAYDLSLEPWCTDKPGLCGNFVDIGNVSMDAEITIPSSGYISDEAGFEDCVEVDPNHTFISKNRDGSFTLFRIVEHHKPEQCDHALTIEYKQL